MQGRPSITRSQNERTRYEFYGHVRYFTYKTLREYVRSLGFAARRYLPVPAETQPSEDTCRSRPKALAYRHLVVLMYRLLSPRWAPEPVLCFQKSPAGGSVGFRKVLL